MTIEVKRITYDGENDVLDIVLSHAEPAMTLEGKHGITADYDTEGNYVAIHVPDATRLLGNPAAMITGAH